MAMGLKGFGKKRVAPAWVARSIVAISALAVTMKTGTRRVLGSARRRLQTSMPL
jgi:hypothetical protein